MDASKRSAAESWSISVNNENDELLPGYSADYAKGHTAGTIGTVQAITRILDGEDVGAGVCGSPYEELRRRVLELVQANQKEQAA